MEEVDISSAKSDIWLQTKALNRWSVLDYFAITHFYEKSPACLNEQALAAGKHLSETHELPCGPGQFEYVVQEALDPTLYVIVKRTRGEGAAGRAGGTRLAAFFVLHGVVYQAPSLHAVATTRLQRCVYDLRLSLERFRVRLGEGEGGVPPAPVRRLGEEEMRVEGYLRQILKDFDERTGKERAAAAAAVAGAEADAAQQEPAAADMEVG